MNALIKSICALIFAISLAGCATRPTQQEIDSADFGPYPADYEKIVKAYMERVLKDPESARYQFYGTPQKGWSAFATPKFGYAICAEINAKNSYGGYTGNRPSFFLIRYGSVSYASHGDGRYGDSYVYGLCGRN